MNNKKYIIANWKMNCDLDESKQLAKMITRNYFSDSNVELVICPPFTNIYPVHQILTGTDIKLGAQNLYYESEGAYTGEISSKMLKSLSCEYVIIGHSERRQYFNEENLIVGKKLKSALEVGLKPILCVGETREERENGQMKNVLSNQLQTTLTGLNFSEDDLIIAYEPVWAIGTGLVASSDQIDESHSFISSFIFNQFNNIEVKILYGGSMNESNSEEILNINNVSGGLIGGASLYPEKFLKIYKNAINSKF